MTERQERLMAEEELTATERFVIKWLGTILQVLHATIVFCACKCKGKVGYGLSVLEAAGAATAVGKSHAQGWSKALTVADHLGQAEISENYFVGLNGLCRSSAKIPEF